MRGGLGVKYKLPTRVPGGGDARQYYAQDTTTLPVRPRGSLTASGTFECMRKSTFYHTTPRASTRLHGSFSSGKACFHRGVTRLSIPGGASPIRVRVPFPAESEERRKTRGPPDALASPLVSVVYGKKYTYMSECTNLATAQ